MEKTCVYIDGFNLYYRAIAKRNQDCKWLDLSKLVARILPDNDIQKITYFSARVIGNPDKRTRQAIYWRALRTIPNLEIVEGKFRKRTVRGELIPPIGNQKLATINRFEEKGSDVNLAVHLIRDACLNMYDIAVVISNDSDLLLAIETVQTQFGKRVVVLNPEPNAKRSQFKQVAKHLLMIKRFHLKQSLFNNPLADDKGTFYKPKGW